MMAAANESLSAFDQALAEQRAPLLVDDDEKNKRGKGSWSELARTSWLFSSQSMNTGKLTIFEDSSDEYEAPNLTSEEEEVVDEEMGVISTSPNSRRSSIQSLEVEIETNPFELAMMRERNYEIQQVRHSISSLNEIQKDLAEVVAFQQDDITDLEDQTRETLHQAGGGLSHLVAMQQAEFARRKKERRKTMLAALTVGLAFIGAVHWAVRKYADSAGTHGSPSYATHGAP